MSTNVDTIASKLGRVKSAAYSIKQSIIEKGQIPSGGIETYSAAIDSISGGGGSTERTNWDVVFIDYDGTILDRYELQDGGTITFPETPVHADKGIVFKKWNSAGNIANAANYGVPDGVTDLQKRIIIGAIYKQAEQSSEYPSETTIDVEIYSLSYATLTLRLTSTVADGTVIDWGDNTTTATTATSATIYSHTYTTSGKYEVVISCTGDCKFGFEGSNTSNPSLNGNARNKINNIVIGTNCTSIGNYAFYQCYSLQTVSIPDSVTIIGNYAFRYCYSLRSVIIPDSVTRIDGGAFQYCYSLRSISIPDSLTSIGNNAFERCYSLRSISIPDSVTSIGTVAFSECSSLSTISYNARRKIYISVSSHRLISSLVNYYSDLISYNGTSVYGLRTKITKSVKNNYDINYVLIPDGVTSIGPNAFERCYSLQTVSIPDSVTSIG